MLEIYGGMRAGALWWCIAVRITARATCYAGEKHATEEIIIVLKRVVVCAASTVCAW